MKRWRTVLVVVAATMLLSSPPLLSWSSASGVHSVIALFESHVHPDIPLDKFAAGRLGIIKPTWNRSYLYVAYRYMAGPGFDPAEQKTLVSLWNDWLGLMPIPPRESDWIANMYLEILSEKAGLVRVGEAANEWLDARGKVPGVEVIDGIGIYRLAPVESTFFSFINCGEDAFHAAAGTLSSMVAKFGVSSPQVKQWVEAQDQVFDNCSDSTSDFGVNSDVQSLMYDEWSKQRSKVPVPVQGASSNSCKCMIYRMATRNLDAMIRNLGASSPQVKQWVAEQDKAFEKCSEPSTYGNPPPAVVPDIPEPLIDGTRFERAQRAYQIAAANFYSGNFGTAAKMFDAIAVDRSSPWRRLARYLVARATIRIMPRDE
jgi:DNA-binding transcriptional regulator YdaS (Cro superfamily)